MVEQREKVKELESLIKSNTVLRIGYARTSTLDQNLGLEVQLEALRDCDVVFSEQQSGSKDNREEFNKAITLAKELAKQKQQVYFTVYKMDRLGRKTSTLLRTIEELKDHGIEFVSIKESIDTSTPTGVLMYQLLGIFSEFELNNLRQRTKDGLAQAKKNGKKLGNQGLDPKLERKIIDMYTLNTIPISLIAKRLKVCESTIYNVARRNGLSRRNNAKVPLNME
ncbi:recombinase family protein [Enterococcus pallens]|uniref:Resolvase/invertase-type recombinase catalytic domain-containing protein n=1 Tax=Enterococcus pallens ATCC BAA-351 TaxID=1158607 RepID=R2SDT5_9ENTE|nr:recombinase family protein [Enterococcus pallens]EOH93690.1 hypothetical protein UAU_02386 [Enterococcus pallens ATCC BAA-351]EOU24530.1 hypothetical protein I588_00517 [Enterococcus pallens ATCC BAA-351]OJG78582.1 hypothetical protein RV10_GL001364 [Enterococcus pallens]